MTARSFGIVGTTEPAVIPRLARLVEAAGYRALWINDRPNGDSLEGLAIAAEVTTTLELATGVIPLDRSPAARIAERVRELGLPRDRVRLGIGRGDAVHGLDLLSEGVALLRAETGMRVLVGALGPKTRALAAREADGILFNWLSPAAAADAMHRMRTDAAGRPVEGVLYVRAIADSSDAEVLAREAAGYTRIPQYAQNFARLGLDPMEATADLSVPGVLEPFEVVDEVVLRAVTATESGDELAAVVAAGAPGR